MDLEQLEKLNDLKQKVLSHRMNLKKRKKNY